MPRPAPKSLPDIKKHWFSKDQAIEYLVSSRTTMDRLLASGMLVPDGRIGRSPRFSRANLNAFLRGQAKAGPEAVPPTRAWDTLRATLDE